MEKITSYLGLLAIMIYAYLLDYGIALLQKASIESFVLTPYLVGRFMANLLLAIGILGLFWFVQFKKPMTRITSLVFILIGLVVMLYPLVMGTIPGLISFMHASLVEFDSKLSIVSAFVVVMGFWGLFFPNQLLVNKTK